MSLLIRRGEQAGADWLLFARNTIQTPLGRTADFGVSSEKRKRENEKERERDDLTLASLVSLSSGGTCTG